MLSKFVGNHLITLITNRNAELEIEHLIASILCQPIAFSHVFFSLPLYLIYYKVTSRQISTASFRAVFIFTPTLMN